MIVWVFVGAAAGGLLGWLLRGMSVGDLSPEGSPTGETARLVRAFEHLAEGVILVDEERQVRSMNSAAMRLLQWSAAEGGEMPAPLALVGGSELDAAVSAAAGGAALLPVEVRRGEQGQTFAVTVGPAGRSRRFIVIEDLSEIASVDARRRDFVANASHELQTPIAALVGMLDLLEDAEGEYAEDLIRRCRRKVSSLSVLTRDLIGLARAQDEGVAPAASSVQIGDICSSVLTSNEENAEAKGLKLTLELLYQEEVITDPVMLATVVGNLVENAIWYTDEGSVTVRVLRRDGAPGPVIEVSDTGSGMSPEILSRIFERFFRGDPARSRASGGSGLGLAIVRNLVGRMGGRIGVSSQLGEGTTFQVELPADPAHPLDGAGQALQLG
ncbi:MAG: PAS domain-containing sensor histidine kinase [Planctomycetes bacterium]|nr:PAS domain-containing sensor histidine kinase [Planctomycetota bacterium]